jgi:TonB family protein
VLTGQLVYPELLRQAGMGGRVTVQAVIDTTGRVEPTSVRILQSSNPGFEQAARSYVLKALWRPGRSHGRAVRVLVNIPIEFRITGVGDRPYSAHKEHAYMPSLYDLFASMGYFAKFIVFVLAFMSVFSWAAAINKLVQILRSEKETRTFAPEFSRLLKEEQLDGAIKLAETQQRSHVARVVGDALAEVKPLLRDRATITAADINSVERSVEREILIVSAELKRSLGILSTTGATAQFVDCSARSWES